MNRMKCLLKLFDGRCRKRPVKWVCALLMAALLLFASGAFALSEIDVQIVKDEFIISYDLQISAFTGEMPEELELALASAGFSEYTCYAGAMLKHLRYESLSPPVYSSRNGVLDALVALQKEDQRILVGMKWSEQENEWILSMLGEKALLPGREFTIVLSDVGIYSSQKLPMRFSIIYPKAGGGSEAYGLRCSFAGDNKNVLWHVLTYESVDASGQGYAIANAWFNTLQIRSLPNPAPADNRYPAYLPLTVEHMNSILDFPTNAEDAIRMAEASWVRFEGTDLAMAGGVNLREEPTTRSRSLGMLRSGALVHVLGQKPGKDAPWYHVRLGREEGYVSGVYLHFPYDQNDMLMSLYMGYLHAARTLDACGLREKPDADASVVSELPIDTLMHVIADVDGGWLYVMIPRDDIGWEMDVDGTSGYLRASDVVQAVSASMLMP